MKRALAGTPRVSAGKLWVVLCAGLLVGVGAPAWAEIVYAPVDPASFDFGSGVYDPTNPDSGRLRR